MKRAFKKYFIPHEENNYKPHFLHTKRTFFYGSVFLVMKMVVVGFVLLLPTTVFVMPDVLASEEAKLAGLVNRYRSENGVSALSGQVKLYGTATDKASDMASRQYFGHISPEGRTLADIMSAHDYSYEFAGENLALGFADSSELLSAWLESPTHRKNILDPDFTEYGIAMLAGNFENEATVFAVNHFGTPRTIREQLKTENKAVLPEKIAKIDTENVETTSIDQNVSSGLVVVATSTLTTSSTVTITNVADQPTMNDANILSTYNHDNSFVSVVRNEVGDVIVSARVFMGVEPDFAQIEFGKYKIPLKYDLSDGALAGELSIPKADNLSVLISPVLVVRDAAGAELSDTVPLRDQVLTSMTPVQKYIRARKTLSDLMPVFVFSREVYLGFMAIFAIALALNVFIEIKKQHPHIILQTSSLLIMLFFLWAI
ncbi:MAG TPA: CAP domain-containing protein [Candidatus Magasanikbacteria bacterium]|nr:CAP domain-containing protein [Candidatus Magasanikbacteria bacterium]